MTDQRASDTPEQEEHARQFLQVSLNLRKVADNLVSQHPDFGRDNFGRAFATTSLSLLLDSVGQEETARYLRALADGLESGAPLSN